MVPDSAKRLINRLLYEGLFYLLCTHKSLSYCNLTKAVGIYHGEFSVILILHRLLLHSLTENRPHLPRVNLHRHSLYGFFLNSTIIMPRQIRYGESWKAEIRGLLRDEKIAVEYVTLAVILQNTSEDERGPETVYVISSA